MAFIALNPNITAGQDFAMAFPQNLPEWDLASGVTFEEFLDRGVDFFLAEGYRVRFFGPDLTIDADGRPLGGTVLRWRVLKDGVDLFLVELVNDTPSGRPFAEAGSFRDILIDTGVGLMGARGADTITGGAGDDSAEVGPGDVIDLGAGNDRFRFGAGSAALGEPGAPSTLAGGEGTDMVLVSTFWPPDRKIVDLRGIDFSGIEVLQFDTAPDVYIDSAGAAALGPGLRLATFDSDPGARLTILQGAGQAVSIDGWTVAGQIAIRVSGSEANDRQTGNDASRDALSGNGGADTLDGRAQDDALAGGAGDDGLRGGDGDDGLDGGTGRDGLAGGTGDDGLRGGEGIDRLDGGQGRDLLIGGAGNDVLVGRSGVDTFRFAPGGDRDRVEDFDAAGRVHDVIDLRAANAIRNFADLRENYLSSSRGDAVIDLGNGDVIRLVDVRLADLDARDFLF